MNFDSVIKLVKHESPVILGILGAVGVIATAVSVAKAAPKAEVKINSAQRQADHALTKIEKAKIVAPVYAKSAAIAGVTVACIVSSTALSNQQRIGLTGAYIALDQTYKRYKDKIIQFVGLDTSKKAEMEISKENIEKMKPKEPEKKETFTFYEEHYDQFFERSIEEVRDAMYYLNRKLAVEGVANLNDLFEFLALDKTDEGKVLGWSAAQMAHSNADVWIDYDIVPITTQDGLEVQELKLSTSPFVDYDIPF